MTGHDLLEAATDELYAADPDEFVGRRGDLAAQARAAGETAAAKRIAALRKPTRSAWVVNQLARSAPGVPAELARLGEQLRKAQRSTDGEAIRELSQRRRQLIDGLVRQALAVSGQRSAPAALRDEVAATLSAAVADPQVAEKLATGTLERVVHREGFGPAGALTLVTSPPEREGARRAGGQGGTSARGAGRVGREHGAAGRQRGRAASPGGGPAGTERAAGRQAAAPGDAQAARISAAERERRRQEALAEAERQRRQEALAAAQNEAAEAGRAAAEATAAEQEQEETVRLLEEQLAGARVRLADTRAQARRLRASQRRAQQALGRLSR